MTMRRIKRTQYKELVDFLYKAHAAMVLYAHEKYSMRVNPKISVSFAKNKTCSKYRNYTFEIEYNIRHYLNSFLQKDSSVSDDFLFNEYKHIQEDKEIGTIKGNWKTVIAALVAHEYAHALDYTIDPWPYLTKPAGFSAYNPKTRREKRGHGENWQMIYRDLRENFVNNKLVQQF